MRRAFNVAERIALYLAAGGKCTDCGHELTEGWHADHREPWAKGGETDMANGAAVCAACNLRKGSRMLRNWQREAIRKYATRPRDFLIVATPGAGKTRLAASLCADHIRAGIKRVVIVTPTEYLKGQWKNELHGTEAIDIEPEWMNRVGVFPRDMRGIAVTYQQVAAAPLLFRKIVKDEPTVVVMDEIHHCADELIWGESVRQAFELAEYRILLSGTPFRPKTQTIPFVRYVDGVSQADHTYGYDEALRDKVCRYVSFPRADGEMEWITPLGDIRKSTFDDEIPTEEQNQRLRTALSTSGDWLPGVLRKANRELAEKRERDADAAGLVVAIDIVHAKLIGELLADIGCDSVIATSDDPQAGSLIDAFRKSRAPWLVAVKMVSEGVDIPRLRVGVFATVVTTELFFRQLVGRFVRVQSDHDDHTATLHIPDDMRIREYAEQIKQERDHVLLQDESEEEEAQMRTERAQGQFSSFFQPLSAGEPIDRGIISNGQTYTPDELRFADSVKSGTPLESAATEVMAAILRKAKVAIPASAIVTKDEPPRSDRKKQTREQMNTLVARLCRRWGVEHKKANADLNQHVGIFSVEQATEQQLERRLAAAKRWFETGSL